MRRDCVLLADALAVFGVQIVTDDNYHSQLLPPYFERVSRSPQPGLAPTMQRG